MKVKIDRHLCHAPLAFCEQCLGKFLKEPEGYERRCFLELDTKEPEYLIIEMHSDGQDTVLRLNTEERKMAAGEGWSYFVNFKPAMYRDR